MRFSDFLLVSDPSDLDFIVGYTEEQNIRISVSDIFGGYIKGSGNAGYVPVFTSNNSIGNSQIFQDGSNIVIGGVNAMGYRLAVGGTIYAFNGAVIETTALGADALRVISEGENIFIIPNDLGQSITSSRRIIHPPAVLTTESATLGQLNAAISNLDAEIDILLALKVDKTSVGVANGVASLDAGGKVPLSQIPDSIIGQVQYMGTWNAFTNTPTLNPLVPEEKGHYYVVSAAGVFGGVDYAVGDWIISNGVIWEKVDNTDAVTSVFGRIGAILPLEADYQSFYPRLSQAYDNPTWINSLAFTKITGVPPFLLENQTITLSGDVTGSGKTSISTTISNNAVSNEKLRDSVGTSVIGRSVFSTGDPADIQANSDGHVLLRSAGNLLFGLISSDSISSINWSKITGTPTTLSGYGITDAYTKTEADNKFVPYTGASANVNLGSNNINANSFIKVGGTSSQFLKADGSVDASQYVPTTRSINAGTGLTGGGNLSSDVNISFDTTWGDIRYAYRTRQLTINGTTYDLSADRTWNVGTVTSVGLSMPSAFTVSNSPVNGSGTLTVVGAGTTADYIRGDGSLAAFPSLTGYVPYTGATQDLDLGTYGLIGDFVRFNPSSSNIPSAEGVMSWDNTDGTVRLSVKGNTYSVPIGQSVISRVRNNTGTNLLRTNYQVVKVAGAQGQRLAVTLAQANNDANSASTLGLVCENISNNQEGFIVNIGQIVNVNTTGNLQGETWLDGDVLYLSPTIAGAITKVKPLAPQHTVIIGYVEYAHANNGKIYVKIDNGYELEELHDVSAEPFINNGLLYRDTTLNLWKSATISTILGYTPAPQGNYITALTGEVTATGPGSVSATLSNSAVTGKVLTGLNVAGNAILSTDSILTAFGKLQHQVNQLVGGLQYEGTWNASTNTPTITSSVGTDGTFYIVSVAGTTNINGINDWNVGDWIVFHDTAWQKVDNTETVTSVFGRVGNIVANQSDYSAFYPLIADIKNGVLTVQGTGVLSGSGTFSANQATNNTITLTHSAVSRTDTTSTQNPSFGGSFAVIDSVTSSAEGHITAINTKTVTIPSTVATSTQTGLLSNADWITFNGKQNTITLTTTGTSGAATLIGSTLNIPNYSPDLSGYVTLATDQTITGLKTIVRGGDVLNFKIGTDTLYGLKVAYNQNELVPSGEATWSFVNTFNRNGSGFETTPISFFRGVLVTGERLLSASINANLLDYYGNNPSGRYPVYAYNTGVQQFSTGIIVGKTTGVVNAATGAISDLPSGVVANFNGRVIGGNAVNSNEFVALGQLGSYVPTSRTLTINGVTFDLSANRSWTITAGVSSVTASSPLFSSGGATPNITIQQANASQNGFLSSSDWTTFNNKANANGSNASGTWGISITGNAETVDGFSASQSTVANNIVVRDSSGYIFGNYINMSDDGNPGAGTAITSFITKQGDNYYRSVSPTNAMSSIRGVASGSWGINITGNAATVGTISADRIVYGGAGSRQGVTQISDWNQTTFPNAAFLSSENSTANAPTTDFTYGVQTSFHRGAPEYRTQFVTSLYGNNVYWLRQFRDSAAWSSWVQVLHSGNFNSYSPTLTGGGASGTWGISITGNSGNTSSVSNATSGNYSWTGLNYFRSNRNTSSDSPPLQAFSDNGSGAIMSFHRGGIYAVNFGLDSDNVMRIGGWSAPNSLWQLDMSGNNYIATSSRAPIFYDLDNTAYYADFNTTGTSINIAGSVNASTFNKPAILVNSSGTSSAGAAFGMQQVTTEGWTGIFVDFEPNTGWGLYHDNPNNFFLFTAETTTGQIGSGFTVPSRSSGNRTAYTKFLVDQTTGDVTVGRVGTAQQDFRAPIFYDSNNTSFYVDPASTSVLNGLTIGGRTALNTAYYLYHSNRDFPSGTLVQTNINYSVSEGDPFILEITGNSYGALIPFDIQVQGYIYANTIINASGISNGTNISGVRAINFNGNLCFWWPYQSYWQGFNIKVYSAYATYPENRVTSISNSAQPTTSKQYDFAIYQSFHTANTSLFSSYDITFNRASSNTDMRAPIFYDSNNTAYYADPNSTSNFLYSRSYYWWTTYTPLTAPRWDTSFYVLQSQHWYSHSGAGDMYLGESGNHISIRGYSTADGSFRSPIFYDSGDTSYYADLNSDSRLLRLGLGGATASGFNLNITGNAQIVRSTTSVALIVGLSGVTGSIIRFSYNGGFVGSISTDGSNTAYNTSSDYRLKEEIVPIENPVTKILSLNPVNFKYKNSKTRQDGFIAHELQEVLPYMVVGEKDAIDEDGNPVYQEVDYSKLTPILIAAIKELKKEIDTLKAN
jgi:hypothetical protein